ncbi:hypothetical protein P168DRAFT_12469 [Aspergillus campestris IBT 28561]|uniref:Uncharacterized protein n=1 Tax=Aspergillus campestris (strain IBT 28561) TaxID=1392248 RepID=A0A2I1DEG9_ASPC2|nr:uncharacterized protein P168DRAFT_12469 [Aspergillus campestris IBT 28561]PKY08254.1 hypothetical protein P168DRAFT_12469 [Aspergillus campestris IBT 28561]
MPGSLPRNIGRGIKSGHTTPRPQSNGRGRVPAGPSKNQVVAPELPEPVNPADVTFNFGHTAARPRWLVLPSTAPEYPGSTRFEWHFDAITHERQLYPAAHRALCEWLTDPAFRNRVRQEMSDVSSPGPSSGPRAPIPPPPSADPDVALALPGQTPPPPLTNGIEGYFENSPRPSLGMRAASRIPQRSTQANQNQANAIPANEDPADDLPDFEDYYGDENEEDNNQADDLPDYEDCYDDEDEEYNTQADDNGECK